MNDYDNMESSPVFEEIRAKGRAEGSPRDALPLGTAKVPTKQQRKDLEAINDLARLEALADRLFAADSWAELLAEK